MRVGRHGRRMQGHPEKEEDTMKEIFAVLVGTAVGTCEANLKEPCRNKRYPIDIIFNSAGEKAVCSICCLEK